MNTETTETPKSLYEKACEKLGRTPLTIDNFKHEVDKTSDDSLKCFGEHKVRTCIKAANLDENGKPFDVDQKNGEWAYEIWMRRQLDSSRPSGVGFVFNLSYDGLGVSCLGSRLLSRNRTIAAELGNNPDFQEYFNEWRGV